MPCFNSFETSCINQLALRGSRCGSEDKKRRVPIKIDRQMISNQIRT